MKLVKPACALTLLFVVGCGHPDRNGPIAPIPTNPQLPEATAGGPATSQTDATSRITETDGSCQPEILYNPNAMGDIPDFVARLAQAYCTPDPALCDELPTPLPQVFNGGDYTVRAPSRAQWLGYCEALVAADPQLCKGIEPFTEPNLKANCEFFFQTLAERNNDSPAFCLAQMGIAYNSADEVGNCLGAWAAPIYGQMTAAECMAATVMTPFTQLDLDLSCCLRLPRPSALTVGQPDQQQCLFQLAQSSMNDRVCLLIADPYPSNPTSQPSCLKALGK